MQWQWKSQLVILALSFVFSMVISGDRLTSLTSEHDGKRKHPTSEPEALTEDPERLKQPSMLDGDGEGIDDW